MNTIRILTWRRAFAVSRCDVKHLTTHNHLSDQYVACAHRQSLPTDFFQESFPRLAVPAVSESCANLLSSTSLFLTSQEVSKFQDVTHSFLNGCGIQLQDRIVGREEWCKRNRIPKSFLSDAYINLELGTRSSLLVKNAMIPVPAECSSQKDRLVNLSNLVVSFLRFMRAADNNVLPPTVTFRKKSESASHFTATPDYQELCERLRNVNPAEAFAIAEECGAVPRCMVQFSRTFRAARVPQVGTDRRVVADKHAGIRHICVLHAGRIWKLNVLDEDGRVCSPRGVWNALSTIRKRSATSRCSRSAEVQPALCTAVNRDLWAKLRTSMLNRAANRTAFTAIDSSLFVVALEDQTSADMHESARSLLLGDYANRYVDKDFQVVASGDRLAIYVDESWSNAVPLGRMLDDVADDLRSRQKTVSASSADFLLDDAVADADRLPSVSESQLEEVRFELDGEQLAMYESARNEYNETRAACDVRLGSLPIGTRSSKKRGLSADFLVQLAIQCAFAALCGNRMPRQIEACSLDKFLDGRVTDMLTSTSVTRELSSLLSSTNTDVSHRRLIGRLLSQASREHRDRIARSLLGESQLFHLEVLNQEADAMRKEAAATGREWEGDRVASEFFESAAMQCFNSFDVITAQVAGSGSLPNMSVYGRWSPGVIRVVYSVHEDASNFCCMLMRNEVSSTATQFSNAMHTAGARINQLVLASA